MNTTLAFLGTPLIEQAGKPITLPTKAIALLGYLASQRHPQRREHVLALLWPDSSEEAARKNGRNTLWAIRRALSGDIFRSSDDILELHPDLTIDLWTWFDQIEQTPQVAVELYRGPFLDGVQIPNASDFELWLMLERERLGQLHMRAIHELVQQHGEAGNWSAMRDLAQQSLQTDMLQEPMYRALMIANAQLGDRNEALRHYELLLTILDRELGVEPLPETIAVYEQIRSGELRTDASAIKRLTKLVESQKAKTDTGTPFIGRLEETLQLDRLWKQSQSGPRLALISGEIGIGKTRLMLEWSQHLATGITTFWMRCLRSTQHLPFMPLIDILQNEKTLQRLQQLVAPIWLAELSRLVPQITDRITNLPTPPSLPADEERRRIFEAFVQTFRAFPEPIIWLIDDLHWIDSATAAWLDYALERLEHQHWFLLATYRTEESAGYLNKLIPQWSRRGILERIQVGQLNENEALMLLQRMGLEQQRIEHVLQQSAGNPLFLVESSQVQDGSIPQALVEIIAERLDDLPGAAQQIVQAAAVLDPGFTIDTLRKTSGRSEEETLDGVDALIAAHILEETAERLTFTHPLIASVVEQQMSNPRRRFIHLRAASIREQEQRQHLAPIAGRLVIHYRQAGDPYRAAEYADLAAEHAQSVAAPGEALAFRKMAQEDAPSPMRERNLGKALMWLGQLSEAQSAFRNALKAFERGGLWYEIARTHLLMAETYLPQTAGEQAIYHAEQAVAALQHCEDPALEAQTELMLGSSRRIVGQALNLAEVHIQQARTIAEEHHLFYLIARADFEQGNLLTQRGQLEQAIEAFSRSIERAQAAQDIFQEVLSHNNLAYAAILANKLELAHHHLEQGQHIAETWSLYIPTQYLWSTQGELALAEGDPDRAEAAFNQGLLVAQNQHNAVQVANYQANLGLVACQRGQNERALQLMIQASTALETLSAVFLQTQIDIWLIDIYMQQGHQTKAAQLWNTVEQQLHATEQNYLKQQLAQLATTYRIARV